MVEVINDADIEIIEAYRTIKRLEPLPLRCAYVMARAHLRCNPERYIATAGPSPFST